MFVLAVCIILLVIFVYRFIVPDQKFQDFINKVPGPHLWPIIGNLPLFLGNDIRFSELMKENWKKFGDRFRFVVGSEVMFFTADVKDVETIIANTSNKADAYTLLRPFLGTSIFLNDGEEAKKKRKILIPSFHAEVLSNYAPVLEESIGKFMKLLDSKQGSEIDFNYWTQLFSLDVLLGTAMGVNLNVMENEFSQFVLHFKRILDCWDARWKNIFYHSDLLYSVTKVGREENESSKILSKFCDDIIISRQEAIEKDDVQIEGKRVSLLDALLIARNQSGQSLSYEDISYEVRGLMVAGHETTFSSVCMTAYELALHQDVQEKIYEEQFEIFGHDKQRYASTEDIKHMKLLEKAIKETLRIHPTVPSIGRKAIHDIHLDGVTIPKGCNIFINIINMSTNPKVFANPDVFNLSRWDHEESSTRSAYSSIPFSAGSRNCLGQSFAMWEMKCLLSQLIRNYKLLPSQNHRLELTYGITIKPKDGLYLKINKRL